MCVWMLCASAAVAQVDLERLERQLEQIRRDTRVTIDTDIPASQRLFFDYGGYIQFNFVTLNDTAGGYHALYQTSASLYARFNIDGVHDGFVRVRSTYNQFGDGDSFNSDGDSDWVEPTLDRAIYQFNLARYYAAYEGEEIDFNVIVRGGRQLVHWANGLALSQELDGAIVTLSNQDAKLDILAGITRRSINDIDSSRPKFSDDTRRLFFGGMVSLTNIENHTPFVYGLVQIDKNPNDALVFGATRTEFSYDTFFIGAGSQGSIVQHLRYAVEAVYEGGTGLSNSFDNTSFAPISQTEEDISAWAFDITLDYLFSDENRSRITGELLVASGDDDRIITSTTFGGNQSGTSDTAYNGFGFINTGLSFNPKMSNLIMLRGGASTYPMPNHEWFDQLEIGTDLFIYMKTDSNAPIDEVTSDGSFLGSEIDLWMNWRLFSDVSLNLRYGVFFPSSTISGEKDPRQFVWTGITVGF